MIDILPLRDLEPPMGDTAGKPPLSSCRAIWTDPLKDEIGAPAKRIIHVRPVQLHAPARMKRLGLRHAQGYHTCGSIVDSDWVTDFRVLTWDGAAWRVVLQKSAVAPPAANETVWFELDGLETATLLIEARRSEIDGWWPSWNLVSGAFVLEGEAEGELIGPRNESLLRVADVSLAGLPRGLTASSGHGEVRYRSPHLDIGFSLNRAGFSHLALDADGLDRVNDNLLRHAPGHFFQGPQLAPVGSAPLAMPSLRNDVDGTTTVHGNRVTYDLTIGGVQRVRLNWEILPDRLMLRAERSADVPMRAWRSSVWTVSFDSRVAPCHVIGSTERDGETGTVVLPAWLHAPGKGSFLISSSDDAAFLRSDAARPRSMTTVELTLGAERQPEGDVLLPAGHFETVVTWRVAGPEIPLRDDTPPEVARAVEHCSLTAMTYRADTATLSNNGVSMHCPICMDSWTATAQRIGPLLPHLDALDLVRDSLERWLDGGPGYASGPIRQDGAVHAAEDEYLMTGTAGLLGLADYLHHAGTPEWLARFRAPIAKQIAEMKARDLDGDGLIESPYRTGVSGTGQWSTCWFDVVSYGWKDAFANAILYPALVRLADVLPRLGEPALADGLSDWAEQLKASFVPTFYNEETGWLAGWRCKEDKLHDHAFLAPNGAAVVGGLLDDDLALDIMQRLMAEAKRVGMPDAYLGLPGNLRPIPDEDLADITQGYPLGFYQNGGRTHSQTRHTIGALYKVGMHREADQLLGRLCKGLADAAVFGGSGSGLDWAYWDGRPCGYEGLLTDQFGILSVALERYGLP